MEELDTALAFLASLGGMVVDITLGQSSSYTAVYIVEEGLNKIIIKKVRELSTL